MSRRAQSPIDRATAAFRALTPEERADFLRAVAIADKLAAPTPTPRKRNPKPKPAAKDAATA